MWVVEWGLLNSMKLKHKMKIWTNMKFSTNQNQEWFGVILWHVLRSMIWTCWQSFPPFEVWCWERKYPMKYALNYSSWTYFLGTKPNDWGGFRMGTHIFKYFPV
jgi:hypothetical protein